MDSVNFLFVGYFSPIHEYEGKIGDNIYLSDIMDRCREGEETSKDTLYIGKIVGVYFESDLMLKIRVSFNFSPKYWYYGWRGGRFRSNIAHAFFVEAWLPNAASNEPLMESSSSQILTLFEFSPSPTFYVACKRRGHSIRYQWSQEYQCEAAKRENQKLSIKDRNQSNSKNLVRKRSYCGVKDYCVQFLQDNHIANNVVQNSRQISEIEEESSSDEYDLKHISEALRLRQLPFLPWTVGVMEPSLPLDPALEPSIILPQRTPRIDFENIALEER